MYPKSLIGRWVAEHVNGMNANQIAKKYDCDHATIVMWLKRNGVFRKATREADSKTKVSACKMYKQGCSLPEISQELGFSHEGIRSWVRTANLIRSVKEAKICQHYRSIKPTALTKDLAFFLGIHAGDGSLGGGRKSITQWRCELDRKEPELAKLVGNLVFKLFGGKTKLIQRPKQNSVTLSVYSKPIAVTLRHYGFPCGEKSRTMWIPREIQESENEDIMAAFVAGHLATDGCISAKKKRYPVAEFSTSSKLFAQQLVLLLKKLGIDPRLYSYFAKNSYSSKEKYRVRVNTKNMKEFLSKIPIVNDKHIQRLEEVKGWSFSTSLSPDTLLENSSQKA